MNTWRAKVSEFVRKWRATRGDVKRAKYARRDERDAEELDMARKGLLRRPTSGSGGGSF